MARKNDPTERYRTLAMNYAEDAHENHFPSRRGVWEIEGTKLFCVYDNSPPRRGEPFRDRMFEMIRERLRASGFADVGAGSYPTTGDDQGYTRTKLFLDEGADARAIGDALYAIRMVCNEVLAELETRPGAHLSFVHHEA